MALYRENKINNKINKFTKYTKKYIHNYNKYLTARQNFPVLLPLNGIRGGRDSRNIDLRPLKIYGLMDLTIRLVCEIRCRNSAGIGTFTECSSNESVLPIRLEEK